MEFRLAEIYDLEKINRLFDEVIFDMYEQGIKIWHKIYPYCEFENDINNKNLYVVTHNENIVATFCLFETSESEMKFEWEEKNSNAFYLSRLAVDVNYRNCGYGKLALNFAMKLAKSKNAKFIRLYVAKVNTPAINFYIKNGFKKVVGQTSEYAEILDTYIIEDGYEIKVN